jgi:catechol 2,3-dioxygenase-like lactoylglutathione lyase family enzyme
VITGLDHVQVAAPPGCEAAARRFYRELLGLPEVAKPAPLQAAGGVWFACGGQQLHVGVTDDFTPARKAHPALGVSGEADLRALAARLEEAGAAVEWDDRLPGVARFYTADPWGNRVELLAGSATTGPACGERVSARDRFG